VGHWWNFIDLELGRGGLVNTNAFTTFLQETIGVSRFEELDIPLKVVTTDFWERKQVVFDSGKLLPPIQASIAIPGLFSPLQYNGHVLVDGGLVNPVPYDLLFDECEVVVAIDVSGNRNPQYDNSPSYFETIFNAMQIMQASLIQEKMKNRPPHIYIRPDIENIRVLDFNQVEAIYAQSMPARNQLMRALGYRI